jgi:mRNA-degrading endonuclease RelE of RelBE toxin-antitoxin system
LVVAPAAVKQLALLPRRERKAMIARAEIFAADPFAAHPWAAPLSGASDRVRIRQGDWRCVLLVSRALGTVILERVAHRREVYR